MKPPDPDIAALTRCEASPTKQHGIAWIRIENGVEVFCPWCRLKAMESVRLDEDAAR